MSEELLTEHRFVFNPKDNGGEHLTLRTLFFDNGDHDENSVYCNQELTLQSYGNCAMISLGCSVITPENLRRLANELESKLIQAKAKALK